MSELSDVSSGGLSDYERSVPPRGAPAVELTDLPVLQPSIPTPEERAREDLSEYWQANPICALDFENLDESQLVAIETWMNEVSAAFKSHLKELREELQAEWQAKEQVLDQLLQASIGETIT